MIGIFLVISEVSTTDLVIASTCDIQFLSAPVSLHVFYILHVSSLSNIRAIQYPHIENTNAQTFRQIYKNKNRMSHIYYLCYILSVLFLCYIFVKTTEKDTEPANIFT